MASTLGEQSNSLQAPGGGGARDWNVDSAGSADAAPARRKDEESDGDADIDG